MPERLERGLVDTSVVIDLDRLPPDLLPRQLAVSALTLAELAAGPHATPDAEEREQRQARLDRVEQTFDVIVFDAACARAFGLIYAAVRGQGRQARGRRSIDLLIAATARAHALPLYTKNPDDFARLNELLTVIGI